MTRGMPHGGVCVRKLVLSGAAITCEALSLIRIMNISSAIFDRSSPDLASCPDESLPEFAFIGRSNVGKSSLLNMLAGQNGLARVSPRPGFTKMINFFIMSKRWRLVDLPGYGFAEVARADSTQFNQAVLHYLARRKNLSCVFALIDSSLPPQKIDLEFISWLTRKSVPFVLVFTKTDTVTPAQVQANIAAFTECIAGWFEKLPEMFHCSATARRGRPELLAMIQKSIDVAQAAAPAEPEHPKQPVVPPPADLPAPGWPVRATAAAREKRPKTARPW